MSSPNPLLIVMKDFTPGLGKNIYVLQLFFKRAKGVLVTDVYCGSYHL